MKYITSVILIVYLIYQSWWDIKTMQVPILINNIALIFSIGFYFIDCIRFLSFPPIEVYITIIFLIIGKLINIYGSGDVKALIAIYLSLRYHNFTYPHPDLFYFLLAICIANIIFYMYGLFFKKEDEFKQKRAPYFPALTAGFIIGIFLSYI